MYEWLLWKLRGDSRSVGGMLSCCSLIVFTLEKCFKLICGKLSEIVIDRDEDLCLALNVRTIYFYTVKGTFSRRKQYL